MLGVIAAVLAVLVFFLKLIGVALGDVDMVVLGLLFMALALALGYVPWPVWRNRNGP